MNNPMEGNERLLLLIFALLAVLAAGSCSYWTGYRRAADRCAEVVGDQERALVALQALNGELSAIYILNREQEVAAWLTTQPQASMH